MTTSKIREIKEWIILIMIVVFLSASIWIYFDYRIHSLEEVPVHVQK